MKYTITNTFVEDNTNYETHVSFHIANEWDDRTFCATDNSWVNDGRDSTHFSKKDEAEAVMANMEDSTRCAVIESELTFNVDEECYE